MISIYAIIAPNFFPALLSLHTFPYIMVLMALLQSYVPSLIKGFISVIRLPIRQHSMVKL